MALALQSNSVHNCPKLVSDCQLQCIAKDKSTIEVSKM